ncbi:MAG: plasmid maintenance protein CcdB [Gammaproteobacteria bacterium]|nr:MAG: plasmid maintenance protein CcdB [Gammaproteobacteria bacterium]
MSQFDVYLNPSSKTRNIFPYIVDIQNSLISDIATRIVVPLGNLEYFKNEKLDLLTPQIEYEDKQLLLLVPQIASMPSKSLKNPIGSLAHMRDEIISALDFAITGA